MTITVLETIEDLGFCEKGEGGKFVEDGPCSRRRGGCRGNTDGGGLCNNHRGNRGGMTKVIEAVRQLRGEAHPVLFRCRTPQARRRARDRRLAMRTGAATLILGAEDVEQLPISQLRRNPELAAALRRARRGASGHPTLRRVWRGDLVPARVSRPTCGSTSVSWVEASGEGADLQLHDRSQGPRRLGRARTVRDRLRRAGRGSSRATNVVAPWKGIDVGSRVSATVEKDAEGTPILRFRLAGGEALPAGLGSIAAGNTRTGSEPVKTNGDISRPAWCIGAC